MASLINANSEYENIMKSSEDNKSKNDKIDALLADYNECCRSKLVIRFGRPKVSPRDQPVPPNGRSAGLIQ
jgi:hypothetical protein